ncbi:MAG: hypothetical protein ISN28_04435 [Ectothiorhodospiraceae bacterium AqS1]|nr:hypothetical protein [Ectothiorhodospiraceae bacterium AqS1]
MSYLAGYSSTEHPFVSGKGACNERDSLPMIHRDTYRGAFQGLRRLLRSVALGSLPAIASLFAGFGAQASAAQERVLLAGTAFGKDNHAIEFRITAKSRKEPIGGSIHLAQSEYEIMRISRHGLIGARRFIDGGSADARHAEFIVFSSSFNDQKATGKPWVAADDTYGCDKPYNAFVALYLIEGEDAVKAIGAIPYARLTEDSSAAARSEVLCFTALPP